MIRKSTSLETRQAAVHLSPARRPTLNLRKRELAAEKLLQCSNLTWCTEETFTTVSDTAVCCTGGVLLFLFVRCLLFKWRKYKGAHPIASRYAARGTAVYNKVAGRVCRVYEKKRRLLEKKYFRVKLWCILYYFLLHVKAKRTLIRYKCKMAKVLMHWIDQGKHKYLVMALSIYHYAPTLKVSAVVIFMYLFLSGDVEFNPGPRDGCLTSNDLKVVLNALWDARHKWYRIGVVLEIKPNDLEVIKQRNLNNADECIVDLLNMWLLQVNPPPTWDSIVRALRSPSIGLKQLADTIEDNNGHSSDTVKKVMDSSDTHHEKVGEPCQAIVTRPSVAFKDIQEFRGLSKEQKEQLEWRLTAETENIQLRFHTLCNKFFDSLDKLDIPVEKLVRHLKGLKALKSVSSPKLRSVMQSYESVLDKIVDVRGVKNVIEEHSTFFDFRPLEYMIENDGQEDDKGQLEKYKQEFEHYIKRRVFECPCQMGPTQAPNSTELHVKLESDYDKLVDLKQFQCQLSFILDVSVHVLRLSLVKDGCIQLIFLIPTFVQEAIFPFSLEQEIALKELGIIKLSCGNYHFPHVIEPSRRRHKARAVDEFNSGYLMAEDDDLKCNTDIEDTNETPSTADQLPVYSIQYAEDRIEGTNEKLLTAGPQPIYSMHGEGIEDLILVKEKEVEYFPIKDEADEAEDKEEKQMLWEHISQLKLRLERVKVASSEHEREIKILRDKLEFQNQTYSQYTKVLETELKEKIREHSEKIVQLEEGLYRMQDALQKKDVELQKKDDELQKKDDELRKKDDEFQKKDDELQKKDDELQKKDTEVRELRQHLSKSLL